MRLRSIVIILAAVVCTAGCGLVVLGSPGAGVALPSAKAVPGVALTAWWTANGKTAETIERDALTLSGDSGGQTAGASSAQIGVDCTRLANAVTAAINVPPPPDLAAAEQWQEGMQFLLRVGIACGSVQSQDGQLQVTTLATMAQPDMDLMLQRLAQLGLPAAG